MYIERINRVLKETDAEILLITAPLEVFYLSGFSGDDTTLVISANKRYIVTDSRYFIQAKEQAKDFELVDISKKAPSEIIKNEKAKKIGFLDKSITYAAFLKISEKLSDAEFIGISEKIEKVRMIKNDEEIKKIRHAAKIADSAFMHILNYIKEGISEKEIGLELEFFMRKQGASGISFETIVASGKRSAMPHGAASDKII